MKFKFESISKGHRMPIHSQIAFGCFHSVTGLYSHKKEIV